MKGDACLLKRKWFFLITMVFFLFGLTPTGFSCSSFAVFGEEAIYGSNLDWYPPAKARLSVRTGNENISFFILEYEMNRLYRRTMGMNSEGLMASLQTIPPEEELLNSGSERVKISELVDFVITGIPGSRRINIPELFDWALGNATKVEEAIDYLEGKTLIQVPGFNLHVHIVDQFGNGIIVEIEDKEAVILRNQANYSLMTNFPNNRYQLGSEPCPRYGIMEEKMAPRYLVWVDYGV